MRRGVVLLTALLLVSVLMAGAISAEDVNVDSYETLKSTLEAGNIAILTQNLEVTYSKAIVIPDEKQVTLGLAGKTITATYECTNTLSFISIGTSQSGIDTTSLTVTGAGENGGITTKSSTGYTCTFFVQYGSITIQSGSYSAHGYVVGTNGAKEEAKRSKDAKITL